MAVTTLDGDPVAVTGGQDGTVRVWDLRAGAARGEPLRGHTGTVSAVAVGEVDGTPAVASGDDNGSIMIWLLTSISALQRAWMHPQESLRLSLLARLDGLLQPRMEAYLFGVQNRYQGTRLSDCDSTLVSRKRRRRRTHLGMSGNPGGVSGRHGRRPMPGRYRVDVPGQREARVRDPVPGIMRGDPGPDALPPDVDIRVMPCPARLHCPRARGPVGQSTAGPLPTGCGASC